MRTRRISAKLAISSLILTSLFATPGKARQHFDNSGYEEFVDIMNLGALRWNEQGQFFFVKVADKPVMDEELKSKLKSNLTPEVRSFLRLALRDGGAHIADRL